MIILFKYIVSNKIIDKKFSALLLYIFLLCTTAYSENTVFNIKNIIKNSSKNMNSTIISWINDYDLETSEIILNSMVLRRDYYIGDIINNLAYNFSSRNKYKKEYLLRILINSFFYSAINNSSKSVSSLNLRIKTNSDALNTLTDRILSFKDYQLRSEILKLIPYTNNIRKYNILMRESRSIIEKLKSGKISPQFDQEIITFLDTVRKVPNRLLFEPVMEISDYTENKNITERARSLLKYLIKYKNN
ncbi:MAG: hypothetical protein GXP33_00140 [Spirochaetes bacterium]|nr:hypothetical protein [Spirochaetota bacterium]